MSSFKDYVDVHNGAIATTGKKPSHVGYFLVKTADGFSNLLGSIASNLFVLILVLFTAIPTYLVVYGTGISEDARKWLMHFVSLCLGVFLGMFKNKKL